MEYGLCCKFYAQPITFKTYTLNHIKKLSALDFPAAKEKVKLVIFHNINALQLAFDYCKNHAIKSIRITSDLIAHLTSLKKLNILDESLLGKAIEKLSQTDNYDIILSMYPGQHVNIGSPHIDVI